MEIVKSKSGNFFLVHAVFVVICTLRDHRGCRDVRDFDVVFVADEGLRVETEGVTHEFGDSSQC
jgi:hypothetical protein